MANVKLKWVFVSDWVGGVGGGRLCTTAGDQLAQGNPPGAQPDNNLHHNLHPRHSYRFEEKSFKFWWYTNYYWFLLEDILTYPIMWSEYSRCNSCPVASKGLLAGCPQEAFKSELRWDQCETSSCTECKLLNKLNSKSNDIEEGWYGALGAKPVEVLGHWPIQPGAQGGVVMDGFLNCPFFYVAICSLSGGKEAVGEWRSAAAATGVDCEGRQERAQHAGTQQWWHKS